MKASFIEGNNSKKGAIKTSEGSVYLREGGTALPNGILGIGKGKRRTHQEGLCLAVSGVRTRGENCKPANTHDMRKNSPLPVCASEIVNCWTGGSGRVSQ